MNLNTKEASAVFTLLCYMIKDNTLMTDTELALYHRFLSEGWDDNVNKARDIMKELINA
jgi:hypothetical protein|nr:MAG TPA: type IV secretory pathway protein [Caudoviricetes sp.]